MTYDRLKAAYLRKVRREKGLKLEALAAMTHYSSSYLSELERNKKNIGNSEWKKIFQSLDTILISDAKIKCGIEFFSDFFLKISTMQQPDCINYYHSPEFREYRDSPLFIQFHLVSFIYLITKNDSNAAKEHYIILSNFESYLSEEEKYAYLVYQAAWKILNNELSAALIQLQELYNSNYKYTYLTSLLNYYLAFIYFSNGNLLSAYFHIKLSKNQSLEENNLYRICINLQLEANIETENGSYNQANKLYSQILFLIDKDQNPHAFYATCLNYAFCLIKQNRFEEALKMQNQCDNTYQKSPQYITNKAWCLYHLDQEACLTYIHEADFPPDTHPYFISYNRIIELLIQDDCSKELEKILNNLLSKYKEELDSTAKEFILTQLLEYYRRTNNVRKQVPILEALLQLK